MAAPGRTAGKPTLETVAARAGVSKSLVSLVLRNSPKVSAASREAVMRAVTELGYRPNAAARLLAERQSHTIGVLLNDLRQPWFADMLDGLNAERVLVAAEAGFAAADAAMQTHGGFGYASEYHVERYWREARLMRIAPVPQEMVLNYLAEHVLGLPRSY